MLNAFPRLLFFQKKNVFTGDHQGMRMRIAPVQPEEGDRFLRVWVWPEPLCFTAVLREREAAQPDESRTDTASGQTAEGQNPPDVTPLFTADFAMDEPGLAAACDWVRGKYEEHLPLWKAHYQKPVV